VGPGLKALSNRFTIDGQVNENQLRHTLFQNLSVRCLKRRTCQYDGTAGRQLTLKLVVEPMQPRISVFIG
jgi:hypothetical protein